MKLKMITPANPFSLFRDQDVLTAPTIPQSKDRASLLTAIRRLIGMSGEVLVQ